MLTLNKVTLSLDNKAAAALLKVNDARRWNKRRRDANKDERNGWILSLGLADLRSYILCLS